jgi:hypothetical protein
MLDRRLKSDLGSINLLIRIQQVLVEGVSPRSAGNFNRARARSDLGAPVSVSERLEDSPLVVVQLQVRTPDPLPKHPALVDMVAHHFKHVLSDDEKGPTMHGHIPMSFLVFGRGTLNSYGLNEIPFNEGGMELRNLQFYVRDTINFLHAQAANLPGL